MHRETLGSQDCLTYLSSTFVPKPWTGGGNKTSHLTLLTLLYFVIEIGAATARQECPFFRLGTAHFLGLVVGKWYVFRHTYPWSERRCRKFWAVDWPVRNKKGVQSKVKNYSPPKLKKLWEPLWELLNKSEGAETGWTLKLHADPSLVLRGSGVSCPNTRNTPKALPSNPWECSPLPWANDFSHPWNGLAWDF